MEETAGPEAQGRRSNHSAELPAIAVKQEPHDEEEEKRNEENRQIVELRQLLEQAKEEARVAEQDAVFNYESWMEWMEKSADYEAERISVENKLTKAQKELDKAQEELAKAKNEAETSSAKLKELCENTQNSCESTADAQTLTEELEETKSKLAETTLDNERDKVIVGNLQRSLQSMQMQLLEAERRLGAAPPSTPAFLPPTASQEYQQLKWQHENLLHEHAQCRDARTAAVAAAVVAATPPFCVAADTPPFCSECVALKVALAKSEESLESARQLCTGLQSTLKAMEGQLKEAMKRKTMSEFTALEWKFEQGEKEIAILKGVADERKVNEGRLESQIDLLKIQLESAKRAGGSELTPELTKKLEELEKHNEELHKKMEELRVHAKRYADAAHTVALLERDNADLRKDRSENEELRKERRERNRAERHDDEKQRIIKLEKDNVKLKDANADMKDRYEKLLIRMERGNQEVVAKRKKEDQHHHRSRSPAPRSSRADDEDDHNQKRIDDLKEAVRRMEEEAIDAQMKNAMLESDRNDLRVSLRSKSKEDGEKIFELTNEVDRQKSALFQKEASILDMRKRIDEDVNHGKERGAMMERIEQMTNQMAEMREKHEAALADSAAGIQRLKDDYQRLQDDYEEANEKLVLLSGTSSRKLQEELTQARKQIEQLQSDLQALTSKLEKDEETRRKKARLEEEADQEPVVVAPPFVLQASAFGGPSGSFVSPTANERKWTTGGFQPLGHKVPSKGTVAPPKTAAPGPPPGFFRSHPSHTSGTVQKSPAGNGTTAKSQSAALLPRSLR